MNIIMNILDEIALLSSYTKHLRFNAVQTYLEATLLYLSAILVTCFCILYIVYFGTHLICTLLLFYFILVTSQGSFVQYIALYVSSIMM